MVGSEFTGNRRYTLQNQQQSPVGVTGPVCFSYERQILLWTALKFQLGWECYCDRKKLDFFKPRNTTRHAEMEALYVLQEQWQRTGFSATEVVEKFSACSLYVTCEPCIVCSSIINHWYKGSVLWLC